VAKCAGLGMGAEGFSGCPTVRSVNTCWRALKVDHLNEVLRVQS
jgi:hypothetical protein